MKRNLQKQSPEVFYKKCVLRNFATFTGKYLYQRVCFKALWHRCFPVNFAKFLKTLFFHRTPPVAVSELKKKLFKSQKCHLITIGFSSKRILIHFIICYAVACSFWTKRKFWIINNDILNILNNHYSTEREI